MDLRNDTVQIAYSPGAITEAPGHLGNKVPVHYGKLESFMKQRGTSYLCAAAPTVADFHLFEMVDQHERMAKFSGQPSAVAGFPALKGIYDAMLAEPKLS